MAGAHAVQTRLYQSLAPCRFSPGIRGGGIRASHGAGDQCRPARGRGGLAAADGRPVPGSPGRGPVHLKLLGLVDPQRTRGPRALDRLTCGGAVIPLVDLRAGFEEVRGEVLAGFVDALESMRLLIGPNTTALESEVARFIGSRDCIGVSNGTDALVLALEACGVGPGDEVIVPSHTFFATVEAVIHVGAVPDFVDVDPVTLTIDPGAVAARHGLTVIEDVSQAHGARAHGRAVGTFGRAAGFSCYFTKNLGAYGEAGLITTDDAEVAGRVRLLRNHGHATKERHDAVGYNSRLDELQAVVLGARIKRLAADNERRRRIAGKDRERLAGGSC